MFPPLEKVEETTCCTFSVVENKMAILYRNQRKIHKVLTELAAKFDFEFGWRGKDGEVKLNLPFSLNDDK